MAVITLTTDLGTKGYYVSAVKGSILSEFPAAVIVDITHEIPPFDILQASFVIKNSYYHFPKGSVHIIGVNAQPGPDSPFLAIQYEGHYFIGSDNGIFSLVFDMNPGHITELSLKQEQELLTFPVRDVFVKAACHLAKGGSLEDLGKKVNKIKERTLFKPHTDKNTIRGMVLYIDSYENVICNITRNDFNNVGKGRKFSMMVRRNTIEKISETYNDVPDGEVLALFSSSGYLEISISKGNAASLLGLKLGDLITIEFNDNQNR